MKNLYKSLILLVCFTSVAHASPLTEQTYRDLLEASKTKESLEQILISSDVEVTNIARSMMKGREFGAEGEVALEKMKKRSRTMLESQIGYEVMVAQFRPTYMDNLTEEEVVEIIKFYKTPAGIAIINKMPVIATHVGKLIYSKMEAIRPEGAKIYSDFAQELAAAIKDKDKPLAEAKP